METSVSYYKAIYCVKKGLNLLKLKFEENGMRYITKLKLLIVLFASFYLCSFAEADQVNINNGSNQFMELEKIINGRLGIYALNTANGTTILFNAKERFPMGCTSKVMGVSAVLYRSMAQPGFLQKKITYQKNQLVEWSPITSQYVNNGMTIEQLSQAAISLSDNTAMDLLTEQLGGLDQINAFARSIGDKAFYLVHAWPEEAYSGGPGNIADSTTPYAMGESLQKLVLGNVLANPERTLLLAWMKNNLTGFARIRAGLPTDYIVADKTGTGAYYGTTNDIAIIWPPHHAPIVIVIFFTQDHNKNATMREDVVASATRIILNKFKL